MTVPALAQPTQTWIYAFDVYYVFQDIYDLAITSDGNVVAVGRWDDRASAVKLDSDTGQVLWEYHTNDNDSQLNCVSSVEDGSGDMLIGGWKNEDALLARLSAQGELIWMRLFNPSPTLNPDWISDMLIHPSGNIYLCGLLSGQKTYAWLRADDPSQHQVYRNLPVVIPRGRRLEVASPSSFLIGGDIWSGTTLYGGVAQVSTSGEVEWIHQAPDVNYTYGVARTQDAITVFVGPMSDFGEPVRAFIRGLDGQGNQVWGLEHGVGDDNSVYHDVCPANPGGSNDVYVVGNLYEQNGGPSRQVLRRISSSGDIIWTVYGTDGISYHNEWRVVKALNNDGVIVAGKRFVAHNEADLVIERYDP